MEEDEADGSGHLSMFLRDEMAGLGGELLGIVRQWFGFEFESQLSQACIRRTLQVGGGDLEWMMGFLGLGME